LSIGRDDFLDIYMVGDAGSLPPHIMFLQSVSALRNFPMQKLIDNPQFCMPAFYKRGRLIEDNNKTTKNLYVIISGTCRVMKKLTIREEQRAAHSDLVAKMEADSLKAFDIAGVGKCRSKVNCNQHKATSLSPHFTGQVGIKSLERNVNFKKSSVVEVLLVANQPPIEVPLATSHIDLTSESAAKELLIEVAVLTPGEVFGLSAVVFKEQRDLVVEESAPVSLVSNGAECILLNKEFFIDNATFEMRQNIVADIRPYPNESTFVENYWKQMDWNVLKREIYLDTLKKQRRHHSLSSL